MQKVNRPSRPSLGDGDLNLVSLLIKSRQSQHAHCQDLLIIVISTIFVTKSLSSSSSFVCNTKLLGRKKAFTFVKENNCDILKEVQLTSSELQVLLSQLFFISGFKWSACLSA